MTPCKCIINGSNDLAMDERASKKTPGLRDLSSTEQNVQDAKQLKEKG